MRSKIPIGHFRNEATIIMKLGNGLKSPCEFYLALTSLQGEILLPFVLNIYRVKIGTIVGIIFFFLACIECGLAGFLILFWEVEWKKWNLEGDDFYPFNFQLDYLKRIRRDQSSLSIFSR